MIPAIRDKRKYDASWHLFIEDTSDILVGFDPDDDTIIGSERNNIGKIGTTANLTQNV